MQFGVHRDALSEVFKAVTMQRSKVTTGRFLPPQGISSYFSTAIRTP